MSPLWRDEIGVYLSPHRLCLVRMRRRPRLKPVAEHEQRLENVSGDGWEAPLSALAAMLGEAAWSHARMRVVLADHWARYVIVPWVRALWSEEERLAYGRQLLASAYGDAIAEWDVRISDAPPHAPRVACALPVELVAGVRAACMAHGGTLLSLQPQLIDAYLGWRHRLPASKSWFVTIEHGCLAAARLGSHGWDRVHSVRIGGDWVRELKRLQTFGRLARSTPEEGQVYVDAPHSWREIALRTGSGTDVSGLQWLEERDTRVTTSGAPWHGATAGGMSPARVCVDFAGRPGRLTPAGAVLLVLGAAAVTATVLEYRSLQARRAGLETRLQALRLRDHVDPAQEVRALALSGEAARVADELSTPWTKLLAELEGASRDSAEIALLSVEPDHAKHRLRITGESRDLTRVLGYVQRLQTSALLRYPMLESHDVKTDDAQRPVRFAMTAEWKELP